MLGDRLLKQNICKLKNYIKQATITTISDRLIINVRI